MISPSTRLKKIPTAPWQSEELFRLLVDAVQDYAIYMISPDGRVMTWNGGAQSNKGYCADEIIGKHYSIFFLPEAQVAGEPQNELLQARRTGSLLTEGWRVRKDGSRFWAVVNLTAIHDPRGNFIGFAKVTRDVSGQRQAEVLRVDKEAAECASRTKSAFLANMSHELRTPLNAIIGFSDLVTSELYGPIGNEKYRSYVCDIGASGRQLLGLVNNLLDLSRLDAGQLELQEDIVDLAEIARQAAALVSPLADSKSIAVAVDCPDGLKLWADCQRIRQILVNLLSNAVKFTPANGSVRVAHQLAGGQLILSVEDTGIGMAPDEIPVAFARFGQVDNSFTRKYEGSGLGLPIVKQFADLHGATIEVSSLLGSGTRIAISFPQARTICNGEA